MAGLLGSIVPMLENIFPIVGAVGDTIDGGGSKPKGGDFDKDKDSAGLNGALDGIMNLFGGVMNIFQLAGGQDLMKGLIGGVGLIGSGMPGMMSSMGSIADAAGSLGSLGDAAAGAAAVGG